MKLRFEVNRAEAFRRGMDLRKSVVTIEVKPWEITQEQRNLIADRLEGIDVLQLHYNSKASKTEKTYYWDTIGKRVAMPVRIQARAPTFDGLMEAIEANEAEVSQAKERSRKVIVKISRKEMPGIRSVISDQ